MAAFLPGRQWRTAPDVRIIGAATMNGQCLFSLP
jgi:hypothetical protein